MKSLRRIATLLVTMACARPAIAQSDETAKRFHVFPVLVDGGGWQSVLLVTNAAQSSSFCTFELHGMSLDRFPEVSGITVSGSTATFEMPGPRGYRVWRSKNEAALALGYATLDCTAPVVAQALYASRDGSGVTGMATVFSSQAGTVFQFPVLMPEASLGIAIANDTNTEASCRFVLENPERENLGQATLQLPSKSTVAQFIYEVIPVPDGFTEGSATLSCDQQVSVIGLQFAGAIFTTLPSAVLSTTPVSLTTDDPPGGGGGQQSAPDLTVSGVSAATNPLGTFTGGSFTLSATVSNAGDGESVATTLRYYRSMDATISSSDTQVGTDAVGALAASRTSAESVEVTVPSSPGTYYYGACVDTVTGESDTTNNCSGSVGVTVQPATSLVFPLRSIHASGNWGTNELIVAWWEAERTKPLVHADYIEWLKRLNVNLIGLSVELTYQDSMDSTVERAANSFSDDVLRQFIREFRAHDIQVYLTLAFNDQEAGESARPAPRWLLGDHRACCGALPEYWPWDPDHADHPRFVAEFWETYTREAVHLARIADAEGVRLYSLGTETDRLFRTRSGGYFITDFGQELRSMVDRVRAVYGGLLTYDMHYDVLRNPDFYGPGQEHLWNDLDLDVVGVSAWFPVTDSRPSSVTSAASLRAKYDQIFQDYLVPLSGRNPGRPVVFLEYGAMDMVEAPGAPDDPAGYPPYIFADANGNGLDDGRETQANMYQALLDTMDSHPGVLNGVFWWDNWIAGDELWGEYWAGRRAFAIRGKPSEEIVRSVYARTATNGPPVAVGVVPPQSVTAAQPLPQLVNVTLYFRDPENDLLTYTARSSDTGVVGVDMTGAVLEITAVSVGEATVTVTASDGGGWATQTVRITSCAPAPGC